MVDLFVKRSLLESKKLFLAINLLFICTIVLFTLAVYANFYGRLNYKEYSKNTNLEDFQMQTYEPLTNYEMSKLEEKYNLTLQKNQKYVYTPKNDIEVTIFSQNQMTDLSHPIITKGRGIQNPSEIVINQEFAKENKLNLEEEVLISNKQFKIVGFASFPQLMYPTQNGGLFPNNKNVANVYISNEDFLEIKNPTNYYLGKFNEELTKEQREEVYEKIKKEKEIKVTKNNILGFPTTDKIQISNITYLLDKEDNFQINVINLEYQFLGLIIGGLSILLGIIAIILTTYIFENLIKKKRREIGIIRAQGYYQTEFEVAFSKYFSYGLIGSIVIGLMIGIVLALTIEVVYKNFFNILHYKPDPIVFIVLIIGAILIFLILNYFLHLVIKNKINKGVLELINNIDQEDFFDISKKRKIKKQYIHKFSTRMKINTLVKNKGKTLLLCYGIFFSSFLFIFGFSTIESFLNMEQNIRGDNFSYDYEVNYSPGYVPNPIFDDQNTTITFFGDLNKEEGEASKSKKQDKVKVMGIENNNEYINFKSDLQQDKVIITSSMQKEFDLKIGDNISVANPQDKEEKYLFVVKDIIDVEYENTIFVSKDYLKKEMKLDDKFYNGLVGRDKTYQEVMLSDENAKFYSYDNLLDGVEKYSKMSSIAIVYIALIAGMISLITISAITSIIISSQKKQMSIMKVFGYTSLEISKFTFSSYKWIILIIYLISYPLSIKFLNIYIDLIMNLIPNINYPLVIKYNIVQFFIGLIFIFLIYYISVLFSVRKINKISLSKSLNNDE